MILLNLFNFNQDHILLLLFLLLLLHFFNIVFILSLLFSLLQTNVYFSATHPLNCMLAQPSGFEVFRGVGGPSPRLNSWLISLLKIEFVVELKIF